ncbi:MAG: glycosyltransferase family 2 protein [Pseudomonadota bacterium]
MTKTVTVIIASYNAEATIERAIRSAFEQTIEPHVIVVDDASTDRTVSIAKSLLDTQSRGEILVQSTNQGPAAARNKAINAAGTAWVTPLDADDAMLPDRLERMVAIADANGWDAVADDQYRVSSWEDGAERRRLWSDKDFGTIELTLGRFVRENIMDYTGFGRELGYIKPLIKNDFLTKSRLSYDSGMRLGEDYDLYAQMLLCGAKFGLVDPLGYLAFDTPGSLSRAHRSEALEKLVRSDRKLLSDKRLPAKDRGIVTEHMRLNQKKVAWAKLGEAYNERAPLKALSSFMAPPDVVGDLLVNMFSLTMRKIGLGNRS